MIKQLLLPLAGVAIFIVLVGIFTQKSGSLDWAKYLQPQNQSQQKTMTIGSKTIQVEIANTESLREKGLSGRSSLAENTGMLFVFDSNQITPTFWMKGMLIPLDMIWISGGKIVKIDKKIPIPLAGTGDNNLIKYPAGKPIDYVLEVNSGFSDQNNIKVGDSIVLPASKIISSP